MRLTNDIRHKIFYKLLADHAISERARAIMRESHEIAMMAIKAAYPAHVGNNIAFTGWLAQRRRDSDKCSMVYNPVHCITVTLSTQDGKPVGVNSGEFTANLNGQSHTLSIRGEWCSNNEASKRDNLNIGYIVPGFADELALSVIDIECGKALTFYLPYNSPVFPEGHIICSKKAANDNERRTVLNEFSTLKATVMSTLNKYSSDTALIKAWPEIAPYVPKDTGKSTSTAIALDVKTLNEICGIPR